MPLDGNERPSGHGRLEAALAANGLARRAAAAIDLAGASRRVVVEESGDVERVHDRCWADERTSAAAESATPP